MDDAVKFKKHDVVEFLEKHMSVEGNSKNLIQESETGNS